MSEDQMQGIPRWRPFRNLAGLAPDKNGEWVRYADASRALRKLREALEEAKEYIENLQLPDKEWSRILDLVVAALREAK